MTHRRLTLAVTIAATMTVAALSPVQSKEVLVWWDYLTGGDGVRMKQLISDFNAAHEGEIEIQPTTLEWGTPYYTKLQTSAMVGEAADIAVYPLSRMPGAVMSGTLMPLDPAELAKVGIADDDYVASNLEAAKVDGQQYVAPLDIHGLVLFYNKEKLAEVGLLGDDGKPKDLDGIDNFNAALTALKAKTTGAPMTFQITGPGVWRTGYSLFGQQGGTFIEDGKILPGDNFDKAVASTDVMRHWIAEGLLAPNAEAPAALAMFTTGESAFFLQGVWQTGTFVDLRNKGELFDWGVMEVPALLGQKGVWTDSQGLAIPTGRDMSPERKAAIYKAIGWISDNSILWGEAGYLPAFRPVLETDAFKAMVNQATYRGFADTAVYDPQSAISGPASPMWEVVGNYVLPAIAGEMDSREAWEQIRSEL